MRQPLNQFLVVVGLVLRLVATSALGACVRAQHAAGSGVDQQRGDDGPAMALEREVERMSASRASGDALWPGFDPLTVPLAVYDGQRTFLFRHPAPPPGFVPVPMGLPATYALTGRHENITANTSADIGGVPTATLLLDRAQADRSPADLAAIAVHEAFHVYQRAHHPGWVGNEADLFTYPTDDADLLALRRMETDALRQALASKSAIAAACWGRKALALRKERYARMDSAFAAYDRGTELNEGLATYVEMRAARRRDVALPAAEFGPADIRRRAYATGPALALLLDRFKPGWPAALEADDKQSLDAALDAALGSGSTCIFGDSVIAGAAQKARSDVAALVAERARRLSAFEAKAGWRVVVEVASGEPLWPQGFDPLNVERIDAARVLHTRFLRMGNGAARVEVLNAEVLTEGGGSHPLFQGVRRVVLTGLAEPVLNDEAGKTSVRAAGLTSEFTGAKVSRSGTTITVRLGS